MGHSEATQVCSVQPPSDALPLQLAGGQLREVSTQLLLDAFDTVRGEACEGKASGKWTGKERVLTAPGNPWMQPHLKLAILYKDS